MVLPLPFVLLTAIPGPIGIATAPWNVPYPNVRLELTHHAWYAFPVRVRRSERRAIAVVGCSRDVSDPPPRRASRSAPRPGGSLTSRTSCA